MFREHCLNLNLLITGTHLALSINNSLCHMFVIIERTIEQTNNKQLRKKVGKSIW